MKTVQAEKRSYLFRLTLKKQLLSSPSYTHRSMQVLLYCPVVTQPVLNLPCYVLAASTVHQLNQNLPQEAPHLNLLCYAL